MSRTLLILLAVSLPGLSLAGSNDQPVVGLHIMVPSKAPPCTRGDFPTSFGCDWPNGSSLHLRGDLGSPYSLYVVALDIDPSVGLAGIAMGIEYSGEGGGIFVGAMAACSDQDFPAGDWPLSGSGTVLTWSGTANCQNGVDPDDPQGEGFTVAYAFYSYAYGNSTVQVIGRPTDGLLRVANCASAESILPYPDNAGLVAFGPGWAFDPCTVYPLPVENLTWGRLKTSFPGKP